MNAKKRIRLIHWKAEEARERAAKLAEAGYQVVFKALEPPELKAIKRNPPDAMVIDLSRLPSHGRDWALFLRKQKATRHIPLVFAGGDPEKVSRIRELVPDAVYTSWSRIRGSVKEALANPPRHPVVPESTLAGYSGTPLPKKLGIKPGSVVLLAGAPEDFPATLGKLPAGAVLHREARRRSDLIIWFVKSRKTLQGRIRRMGDLAGAGGLWIAWPKGSSGEKTDLNQMIARKIGLAAGLVDYKICSIDATWSGLRFTKKKSRGGDS